MAREQTLRSFEAAMRDLPSAQSEAITRHRVLGFSFLEIAELTGKNKGAVRTLVYRGLARLTLVLGDTTP